MFSIQIKISDYSTKFSILNKIVLSILKAGWSDVLNEIPEIINVIYSILLLLPLISFRNEESIGCLLNWVANIKFENTKLDYDYLFNNFQPFFGYGKRLLTVSLIGGIPRS